MNANALSMNARGRARRASRGRAVDLGARAGFVARGVIYLLVGTLALRIAFSDGGGQQADRGGAIAEIAAKPFGSILLWALGVALAGMALWRLSEAFFGQAGPDGDKAGKRAVAAARFVFYAFVSYSVLSYAAGDKGSGSGSSDRQTDDVTARALEWTGGQWIVGIAGAGVIVAGLWMAYRALTRKYHKHLKTGEMTRRSRQAVDVVGVFGGTVRGAVFATAGGFAVAAAVRHEPGRAKGMDDTLRSFTETPAGPWLLVLIAIGLAAFGLFSWANARWRKI
ncbi:protein of unknown function (DUF1206) [Streptomyces sp. LamerLS-316]|uniref:DUF1206 domain-containing protein n=1 Tax=unclassified Streptomyces TaxID=2593676 RepID=UPI000823B302|nr:MULTISPECIES: DUF1206 domain-containing protein [unclassified Streptomyces]MYQ37478.1 DUF1206 domain-containing protein [Streptomyces sp. SID4921]SCK44859.1 protein of unknown function (DUF1206) [Streptomyces sp. LamerLS-316]